MDVMKIEKNIYIYTIIAVVIIGGVVFWMGQNKKGGGNVEVSSLVSPSPTPSQSFVPSQTPKVSAKNSPKPTPTLDVKVTSSYQGWVDVLDPIGRHLVLNEDCTTIVPSQIAYPNNTKIMLDNTFSTLPHILKIGSQGYSLDAHSWIMITLSSKELPTRLTIFCGSMELGGITLEK
jgi:hypothetical protein